MSHVAFRAMQFAMEVHKNQKRKYTNVPYFDHLSEVVGIASTVAAYAYESVTVDEILATAWLHDCMEDQGVKSEELVDKFGVIIAEGVWWLSDLEEGNRDTRKRLSRERLSKAPGWVQTIKCADLISNTGSIVQHDPKFAKVYLREKELLLEVLDKADRNLWDIAYNLCKGE